MSAGGGPLTVACVLRTGGDFDERWVRALKAGFDEHLSQPFGFVCLTDSRAENGRSPDGIEWRPALAGWPGWWCKLEALAPGHFHGRVLLCDLDTLPVGPLDDLAGYAGHFALIWDLNGQRRAKQSGVMAFKAGPHTEAARLFDVYATDEAHVARRYRGDGEWLNAHAANVDALQDLYPRQVVSFKWQARRGPPAGATLVCGHGQPRFSSPSAGWAHELFRERAA